MKRFGWYSAACAFLIMAAIGIVAALPHEPRPRRWDPSSDELGIASSSFAGSPFGSSGVSGSPNFSGNVTARFFYASADAGTVLNLKDFTKICWSTNGTDTNRACISASQGASAATTIVDGSGGGGGGNFLRSSSGFSMGSSGECSVNTSGISCSAGSAKTNMTNSQNNIRTSLFTNTPAGGYSHIVGTSISDASDAGTFHTVLMSWGTGVTTDATGNIKGAMTGGGLIIGAIDAGAALISATYRGTATLDFASAATGVCSADLTITVTGAVTGAEVELGIPNGSVVAGSMFSGWVSAANTVTVRHCCNLGSACDPASGTFSARVWNP